MRHWLKWLLGVFACIIIGLISLGWYFSRNWEPIVEYKLKELVHNSSKGLYSLKYDKLNINLSFGNIELRGVELIPDSLVYRKQVLDSLASNKQFYVNIERLKVKRFSFVDVLFNRKLSINAIALDRPVVHVINETHSFDKKLKDTTDSSFYLHVKKVFDAISVKKIEVDSASIRYTEKKGNVSKSYLFDNVELHVVDVLIDSLSAKDSLRMLYSKMIDLQIRDYELDIPNSLYKVAFDKLHINTKEKFLLLEKAIYRPKLSKAMFFREVGKNVTMNDLEFDKIQMENIDFDRLFHFGYLNGSIVNIQEGAASFSQDKRYPGIIRNKIGRDPYHQLMKIKTNFHFDTVFVKNVSVNYSEYSALFNKEGVITFTGATGHLSNVTNDSLLLRNNKFMKANLAAKVMNAGRLQVRFGFDMLSKEGGYTYAGKLSPMSTTAFNRILVPLVNVQIPSGTINSITFDMHATNYKNWGSVEFDYTDLRINVLGKPVEGEKDKKKKAVSFLLNNVLINSSNPDSKGNYHKGVVQYDRIPEYSFFKTIWQSLLQGIIQCAGISPEKEARLIGVATASGKAVSGVKKAVGKVGDVTKKVGKDAGKVIHKTDRFFKKVLRKDSVTEQKQSD